MTPLVGTTPVAPEERREQNGEALQHASDSWSPSQVVAHNLTRARHLRGLTQGEIADRLTKFTGTPWSAVTVAQAEGSVAGNRVRQFTANELVALARTFDLPVLYFFLPPEGGGGALRTADAPPEGWPWEYLVILAWGHLHNYPILADRAAPWAHASAVAVADGEVGDANPIRLAEELRRRRSLTAEDTLAVAFNGMARRALRGSIAPRREVEDMVASLRRLADALATFNEFPPGAFLHPEELRGVLERKQARREQP